jgi:hypothetical protein
VIDPVWSSLSTDLPLTRVAVCPRWSWDRCCLCDIRDCHQQAPRPKLSLPSVLGIWNCCTCPPKKYSRRTNASVFHTERCIARDKNFICDGAVHPVTGHEGPDRGVEGYSCTISLTSVRVCGRWSTPRPGRFTPWNETRYPFYRKLDGPQFWMAAENLAHTGIRFPDRPARSESLYWLSKDRSASQGASG